MPKQESGVDVKTAIRRRIVAGEYLPGAHLPEANIGEELGVSRTPVRMALRDLAADGLVEIRPRQGAFVAQFSRLDVQEVFMLRIMLEAKGAALAAARRSTDQAERIVGLVDEMDEAIVGSGYSARELLQANNTEFHAAILEAARSPRLRQAAEELFVASVTQGAYYDYADSDIQRSQVLHRAIAQAIADGKPDAARHCMAAHLESASASFLRKRFGDGPGR